MKIPLCIPNLDSKEYEAVKEVLNSGWLTDGPRNAEFEENFAGYIGVKRAVSLNSCASALQLAIEALSIKGEVILPGFTFAASANAIVNAGAVPVFADINYNTCNIDPRDILRKISSKTEAIMVVHYAGQSCDMDRITEIARKHSLKIIEDSAQTAGGMYKDKKTGSFGTGCFSFFPTKNMTTGEGGMLTSNDDRIADRVKTLAGHGMERTAYERQKEETPWLREAAAAGYNYRMSNILAAIGVEQLKKLDSMNRQRRKNAAYLNEILNFEELDEIDLPVENKNCKHVYQMYTVKLKNIDRTLFIKQLREKGVMASVHFAPPVHLQDYYMKNYKYKKGDLPVTERVADTIVTLPMYPQLTKNELDYMADSIKKVINNRRQ